MLAAPPPHLLGERLVSEFGYLTFIIVLVSAQLQGR
jgi:hypothetical protein